MVIYKYLLNDLIKLRFFDFNVFRNKIDKDLFLYRMQQFIVRNVFVKIIIFLKLDKFLNYILKVLESCRSNKNYIKFQKEKSCFYMR